MPLPLPNLDDRRFAALVEEAKKHATDAFPEWNDLSPHDPGMVLVEMFAHLTELMLYRLNRVPDKSYVAFLNLLGVTLYPPTAAAAELTFTRKDGFDGAIKIPLGTRVTVASPAGGGPAPIFRTVRDYTVDAASKSLDGVLAVNADLVEGELIGTGTGAAGQSMSVSHPPVIAAINAELDLIIRVETDNTEDQRETDRQFNGKKFREWKQVSHFTEGEINTYLLDRSTGTISFSPRVRWPVAGGASLSLPPGTPAVVPPSGKQVRAWYRYGGGARGNVDVGSLSQLVDKVTGIDSVTNNAPATGGNDGESLENARVRAPQQIFSLERAVTARDFEFLARQQNPGIVSRAVAVALRDLWEHAQRGSVSLLLVPEMPADKRERPTAEMLIDIRKSWTLDRILGGLNGVKPIGMPLDVGWVQYKTVTVSTRVVINRGEDRDAVKSRIESALYRRINPLPGEQSQQAGNARILPKYDGWAFGETLRDSDVYDIILKEPGVKYVQRVSLAVDKAPRADVTCLSADTHQPETFYAGSGNALFRSVNGGDGWELIRTFDNTEKMRFVESHPESPGWLVAATEYTVAGQSQTAVYISADCGETWYPRVAMNQIRDMAWMKKSDGHVVLLLVSQNSLYSMLPGGAAVPVNLMPGMKVPNGGYWAVAAASDNTNRPVVVVSADNGGGVFISRKGAEDESFSLLGTGLKTIDVRYLIFRPEGVLWAGLSVAGQTPGGGTFTWDFNNTQPTQDWRNLKSGWEGGSCRCIAFDGRKAYAATFRGGVLRMDLNLDQPVWVPMPSLEGLPRVDSTTAGGDFREVTAVAISPVPPVSPDVIPASGRAVLASGKDGVFRSTNGGDSYSVLIDPDNRSVTIPPTWLFCSGKHDVQIITEDEARKH